MTDINLQQYLAGRSNILINRHIQETIEKEFNRLECIVLLGPRQIGKSTFAKNWARTKGNAVYRDLEDPEAKNELGNGRRFFKEHKDKIIILDEIQENPTLFQSIKVHIDEQRFNGNRNSKFLLLGSASLDLQRGSAKSLTGRCGQIQMSGILLSELLECIPSEYLVKSTEAYPIYSSDNVLHDQYISLINYLLTRGGLPTNLFANDVDTSEAEIEDIIEQYMQNDLKSFGLNVDSNKMSNCLDLIARTSGQQYEIGYFTKSTGFKGDDVRDSLSALEQLLLVRKLHPLNGLGRFEFELTKHPKLYIRDTGFLLSRIDIDDIEMLSDSGYLGGVWEGFVIETIVSAATYAGVLKRCNFFRTHTGDQELDLVLKLRNRELWGIEIKYSENSQPSAGSIKAAKTLDVDRRILVHSGLKTGELDGGFKSLPLIDVLNELRGLSEYRSKRTNKPPVPKIVNSD